MKHDIIDFLSTKKKNFEDISWLFFCSNQNRGIIRQNFDEAALLWKAVASTSGPILEIGRRHGGTTVLLLSASASRTVTSIDIAPAHHPECDIFFEEIKKTKPERLELLVADSRKKLNYNKKFGLLFIDGDHSYEGVRADTIAHWDALTDHDDSPALAVFHDAVPNNGLAHEKRINHCEGVQKFCNELIASGSAIFVASAGSSLLLKKIKELPDEWIIENISRNLSSREDVISFVKRGGIGLELGVAEGYLSERFLRHESLAHLYSIDMYAGDRGHDDEQYKRAISRLAPFKASNTLIKLRFDQALDLFPDAYFDFIYVDGYAHTGEEKGKTFDDWYPKLKPGGIIAGDDYCDDWPLVVESVDQFLRRENLPLHVIKCSEDTPYSRYPTWYTFKPVSS